MIHSNKKRNLKKYSVVFFKAFSKEKGIWRSLYDSNVCMYNVYKMRQGLLRFCYKNNRFLFTTPNIMSINIKTNEFLDVTLQSC